MAGAAGQRDTDRAVDGAAVSVALSVDLGEE
jgi:hypothetical protein